MRANEVWLRALRQDGALRQRILYTLWLVVVFRAFAQLPTNKLSEEQINALMADNLLAGIFDVLAGGSVLSNFSIMASGVFPYVMAAIVVQIAVNVLRPLRALAEEGESGHEKLKRIQMALTIVLSLATAWTLTYWLGRSVGVSPRDITLFTPSTFLYTLFVVSALVGGSMMSAWLAQLITRNGIGEGSQILLLAGVSLVMTKELVTVFAQRDLWISPLPLTLLMIILAVILPVIVTIFLRDSQRRVTVSYGRRVRGRIIGPAESYIPIPLHSVKIGSTPVYAAYGWIALFAVAGNFFVAYFSPSALGRLGAWLVGLTDPLGYAFWGLLFAGSFGFTLFFNEATFQQEDMARTLQHHGGFIPGVRPGEATRRYLTYVLRRVTVPGALLLTLLVIALPNLYYFFTGQDGLVLVLSVILITHIVVDLTRELEARLLLQHYEGFLQYLLLVPVFLYCQGDRR